MRLEEYSIRYTKSILQWDEGLPLGNGKMGCLIYGDGPIRFSLDRTDLWDTRPHSATQEKGFTYENLVRLSTSDRAEDWEERARLFERVYDEYPYPSKITAGRIELDFGRKIPNVRSKLNIRTAIATLRFSEGSVEAFAHATRFVGVTTVEGEYTLRFHLPEYLGETGMDYAPAEFFSEGNCSYYVQKTKTDLEYAVVVLQRGKELYFTVETNHGGADFVQKAKEKLLEISTIGYENLKKEHIAWWKAYWKKSSISIGDSLLEKTYYRSTYLLASCSREGFSPMPLQGVWTADNDKLPPWKGDYHHDTNTQLSYQSYLKANRLSEGRCFLEYLWAQKPRYEKFAKEFYKVDGLFIPGVSTFDGKPMGGWAQYSLSPTMTVWTAQSFDEYYLYTGDEDFLRNRAFPFFEKIAHGMLGLLEERAGKLYLPISTSPEIHDARREAYLKPNSNFDLALLRYLFATLIKYCKRLGKEYTRYALTLEKLDDIAVIDGCIGLDSREKLNQSHRHFSHLMCLYPLHLINYDTEEHKTLYHTVLSEIERLGTGEWVGFSFAMCAQIYAMAEKGNAAYEKLWQFADGFVAENGFHLNGDFKHKGYSDLHYRPFTLESSFGYCDALQEMLLQEHQGYIHVFPAIPSVWEKEKISFTDLRSYGGVLVSAEMQDGELKRVVLKSKKKEQVLVKNTFAFSNLTIKDRKGTRFVECAIGENLMLTLNGRTEIVAI